MIIEKNVMNMEEEGNVYTCLDAHTQDLEE